MLTIPTVGGIESPPKMGRVMKLLNYKPLNDLVDQEPDCAVPLAAWCDTVDDATWDSYKAMAQDLEVAPAEGSNNVLFTVVPQICLVEAKVLFPRRIVMVTGARLLRAFGRRAS